MSKGSMQRLEELLAEALERPAEERAAFLDDACQGDTELRREAEELLRVNDKATAYFDGLASDLLASAGLEIESAARPSQRIGPYQALEAIGHGGMGVVYRAERVDGAFDQKVALKLLHRDMDTPELRARFLAERQILARLSHPNIAHLLDGGVTDEGRPYLVMEYVEGQPITHHCQANALPVEEVLRLYLVVIDAVSYLHRNLVVHRDLKPSNVFVDRGGNVKLLDFGIAKLLADAADGVELTRTGEQLGTPGYAAPEQLVGAPVTTATDVWALGVVLYELLTGTRPHKRVTGDRQSVTSELPPTPSSILRSRQRKLSAAPADHSDTEPSPAMVLAWRRVAGDLDTICLKALRPEPEARYPSAEQLGQDIERFLQGLPVRARKSTLRYRAGKFAQRHSRGLFAVAGALALIVAGFAYERRLRDQAEKARTEAQQQAAKAVAVSGFLSELLSSVDPMKAQGREVTVADVLAQAADRISKSAELQRQPAVEAVVRLTIGNTFVSLGKHAEAREHLERAVELRGGLEARDPEALAAASSLAALYSWLGRGAEAETIVRRVLQVRVETLGEDHRETLSARNQLADLLWSAGQLDEVEQLDRKTLEIRRRLLGEDHPDTLKSLNGLAVTLFTRGVYAEAATIFEQTLVAAKRQLGDNHPHTITLANNLAAAYLELGQYGKAEPLMRHVIEARTRVLGEQHPDTATSVHNLGVTLLQMARYEEAAEQLRRAIAARKRLPDDGKNLYFSRCHLADVYRELGRLPEAEALYLDTIKQQQTRYGHEHPEALRTISGLAELRLRQHDLKAAETLLRSVLEPQARARGDAHPETMRTLSMLARVCNEKQLYAEAQRLSDRAIEAGTKVLGGDHLVVLDAVYERARALAGLQQTEAARPLALRVHEVRAGLLGETHPATVEAARLLRSLATDGR
jgi:serine/threonine protein kinase/Tfp pilus assembly protein PilF